MNTAVTYGHVIVQMKKVKKVLNSIRFKYLIVYIAIYYKYSTDIISQ